MSSEKEYPEVHNIIDRGSDIGVLPVEVGLVGCEEREVILVGGGVVSPGRVGFTEDLGPVIGWKGFASGGAARSLPDVPGAFRRRFRGARGEKPGVLWESDERQIGYLVNDKGNKYQLKYSQ